ncbi:hypothetical protein KAI87_12550, partial [Myxococcota bacterium]|nr:hypothetical protein [Myxococcota bacterium]
MDVSADPIPGGARLSVDSYHTTKDEKLTLVLQAEVLDTERNELRTVNLSVLVNGMTLNPDSYRGHFSVDISYDDINKYLQKRNPLLKLNPGKTQLYVAAMWVRDNGFVFHRAGGPGRGGEFRLPESAAVTNATGIWAAGLSGSTPKPSANMPLDMAVGYPKELTKKYGALKPDGKIVTRLESEFKGVTDKKDMVSAIHKLYDMVGSASTGDRSAIDAMLGADWDITTVNRYWLKDDGSAGQPGTAGTGFFKGFRVDADGLPVQDPMHDEYMDDSQLRMTGAQGAIRLRKNKQATVINIKPGGGREDAATGIRQRVEVGVELKPDATAAEAGKFLSSIARDGTWNSTIFNHAEKQVQELDASLKLADALNPWLEVVQDRHKFTVKNNKTGVEVELSLDKVVASTMRGEHAMPDGSARSVEFYVLEAELDHLQLQSKNQGNYAAAGAEVSVFSTDAIQDDWLAATGTEATMDVEPRLHELSDLENSAFRSTDSYLSFEKINETIKSALFPNGFMPAKQKAAQAGELLGLSPFTKESATLLAQRLISNNGLKWTPELEAAFDALLATPEGVEKVGQKIAEGKRWQPKATLHAILGPTIPELSYDYDNLR